MFSVNTTEPSNFAVFLSTTYGTGNIGFDVSIAGFVLLSLIAVVAVMKVVGLGRVASEREAEILADVAELLNEMNIQLHELKSLVHQEFTFACGELGQLRTALRRLDIEEIRAAQMPPPPPPIESNSLTELFQ